MANKDKYPEGSSRWLIPATAIIATVFVLAIVFT
jgi:hypothetical protein